MSYMLYMVEKAAVSSAFSLQSSACFFTMKSMKVKPESGIQNPEFRIQNSRNL